MERLAPQKRISVLVGLFFSLLICTDVWAQSTAQISGVVKDQTGAGVTVTATNVGTGIVTTVIANEGGAYTFAGLQTGVSPRIGDR
jgi:hypothetical protein